MGVVRKMRKNNISNIINKLEENPHPMQINNQKNSIVSQSLKEDFEIVIFFDKWNIAGCDLTPKLLKLLKTEFGEGYVWNILTNRKMENFILGRKVEK